MNITKKMLQPCSISLVKAERYNTYLSKQKKKKKKKERKKFFYTANTLYDVK